MLPALLSIGIVYLLAIGGGRISATLGVPRVTGYLLTGLAAGPAGGNALGLPAVLSPERLESLAPLHDVILGLIVFTIGGSFRLGSIRRIGPLLLRVGLFEMGLTALLVGVGTLFFFAATPLAAAFLAVVSVTTAPAATQMVMREYRAEGSLSDTILPLVGINNLTAIVVFIVLKNYGLAEQGSILSTAVQLLTPFGAGAAAGMVVALMDQRLDRRPERQILVLGSVSALIGLGTLLDVSGMLASLVAGLVAVNASPYRRRLVRDLAETDYPLYVLFFIMAGAALHLEHLAHMGLAGAAYVALRSAGKVLGCRLGAAAAGAPRVIRSWLGPAMLAQAGLAIGLGEVLAREWAGPGKTLQTLILASVVVFEVAGPLLTRVALVRAGEVTVLHLLQQRSQVAVGEGLLRAWDHFRRALGLPPSARGKSGHLTVGHIMRRNVEALPDRARFDEVLRAFGQSRFDRLPVVNGRNELVGVIRFADIADMLFDPGLRRLIVADDIAREDDLRLHPEDSLAAVMTMLRDHPNENFLLVVDGRDPKRLLGMVRQNDVLSAQS